MSAARISELTRQHWPLYLLVGFTAVALVGYAAFGLAPHGPENLARLSDYEGIGEFYAISFKFFGQLQVWLSAFVLGFYLLRHAGGKWLSVFAAVYALSLASETIGTATGLPFGPYVYSALLGPKLFGLVPVLIPISWFTIAVPAFAFALWAFPNSRWARVLFGAGLVTLWDISLDPAMSYLTTYWFWGEAGPYYGMPLINFAGWYLTGAALMGAFELLNSESWVREIPRRTLVGYYLAVLVMPVGMCIAAGLWWAVLGTVVALAVAGWIIRRQDPTAVVSAVSSGRPGRLPSTKMSASATDAEFLKALPLPHDVDAYFTHHSRSFSFASDWFDDEQRRLVDMVYAFCRVTDDLVDACPDEEPETLHACLDRWEKLARASYDGQSVGVDWLDELLQASAARGVPYDLIRDLVAGVRMDIGDVRIQTMSELDLYCYRVASVVGLWMCHLFGVKTAWVLERAASLGSAMQLTNILRDVGEDLRQNRMYLPADVLAEYGLGVEELQIEAASTTAVSSAYRSLLRDLIAEADRRYAFAWEGIAVLDGGFGKAVAVAANVYQGIHEGIRRNDYDNLRRRAFTTRGRKLLLALGARRRLSSARQNVVVPVGASASRGFAHPLSQPAS
ncbi:MAG: carotenoid biosynthesis protein [Bacteroidota bacterium]